MIRWLAFDTVGWRSANKLNNVSNSFRQCDSSAFPSFGGTMSSVDAPQRWPLATLGSSRLYRLERWSKSPRGSPPLTHSTADYESSSTFGYMPVYGLSLRPDPGWFKFMGNNVLGCASMQPHVGGACKCQHIRVIGFFWPMTFESVTATPN